MTTLTQPFLFALLPFPLKISLLQDDTLPFLMRLIKHGSGLFPSNLYGCILVRTQWSTRKCLQCNNIMDDSVFCLSCDHDEHISWIHHHGLAIDEYNERAQENLPITAEHFFLEHTWGWDWIDYCEEATKQHPNHEFRNWLPIGQSWITIFLQLFNHLAIQIINNMHIKCKYWKWRRCII